MRQAPSLSGTSNRPSGWQHSHTCGGRDLCHQAHCSGSGDSSKDALSLPCLSSPDLTTPETDLLVALLLCTLRVDSIWSSHLVLMSHPLILPHDVLCYYIKKICLPAPSFGMPIWSKDQGFCSSSLGCLKSPSQVPCGFSLDSGYSQG